MTTNPKAGLSDAADQISPESKEFLVSLFTELRDNLADRTGGEGQEGPNRERAARESAIFDALLTGLARGAFPDDEAMRRYVIELAEATDEETGYQQAALEHRALTELVAALNP